MVRVGKEHDQPPAPVAASWRRIEEWLDEQLPAVRATLRPGISEKDLAKFEKLVGRSLPEDVRQSWLIHDGQGHIPDEFYATDAPIPQSLGLLFRLQLNPLLDSKDCLSPRSVLAEWKSWKELIEGEAQPGYWDEFDEPCTSSPEGAIRCKYSHPGWLPLATLVDSDYLGIDLDPGSRGTVGQVINFGRNSEEKHVLAASWAHFLEDFADELEAGNFAIDLRRKTGEFQMREPGPFHLNYRAWSQAKLGPYRSDRDEG